MIGVPPLFTYTEDPTLSERQESLQICPYESDNRLYPPCRCLWDHPTKYFLALIIILFPWEKNLHEIPSSFGPSDKLVPTSIWHNDLQLFIITPSSPEDCGSFTMLSASASGTEPASWWVLRKYLLNDLIEIVTICGWFHLNTSVQSNHKWKVFNKKSEWKRLPQRQGCW